MTKKIEHLSKFTVPGASPSLLQGGPIACMLLHGFSANPEEMDPLAGYLHASGFSVLNIRLAGHGSTPGDLARVHWTDWLLSVEDGLDMLAAISKKTVLIGQAMGGMLALASAARFAQKKESPIGGVISLAAPFYGFPILQSWLASLLGVVGVRARKQVREHPELRLRREEDYPAYVSYPVRIIPQLNQLNHCMRSSLKNISCPALVIQSRQGLSSSDDIDRIHAALGSSIKEKLTLDGFDRSLVMDEKREFVFSAIVDFINRAVV